MWGRGLHLSGWVYSLMTGFCKRGKEPSCFMKDGTLHQWDNCQLLCLPWHRSSNDVLAHRCLSANLHEQRQSVREREDCRETWILTCLLGVRVLIRECIQKFPDWMDDEINNNNNNKHSLRSNTKSCGCKTLQTDSQNIDTTAPSGRELYHLHFSLQAASPETFGYTLLRSSWGSRSLLWPALQMCLHVQISSLLKCFDWCEITNFFFFRINMSIIYKRKILWCRN
jgi:hypothetical protein